MQKEKRTSQCDMLTVSSGHSMPTVEKSMPGEQGRAEGSVRGVC